ncbi:hypothetical protein M413DRAFT_449480 [Hebeloma cylindrosporum]|uniref:DUF6533 domain-containing protein n=1 Tax=Hebeloma cylindrosporum TaxID=76867 RepID=A0A0C3BV44_HEBCY|nr:hypothetical protein M413DRAFT_449480 [Hebeloma cylindrosporum h7]
MVAHPKAIMFMRFSIQYSTIALLWYDYTLTWTREVQYFWTKRFTLSTALYIVCRYGMVANVLYTLALANKLPTMRLSMFSIGPFADSLPQPSAWRLKPCVCSCDEGYRICAVLSVLGRIGIVTVWGSRTYAIFNRSKIILALFGSLGLAVIGLAILHVPYVSCTGRKGSIPVPNLLSISTVAYEILSAVFTTVRSVQALNVAGSWKTQKSSLTFLVLREGLLYFGFVTSFSMLSLIFQLRGVPGTFFPRFMNAYTMPLAGLMTARFLLHLREWDHRIYKSETDEWLTRGGGGGGGDHVPIQFKKTEPTNTTQWTINDVLGDDPLLRPLGTEMDSGDELTRVGA